MGVQGKAAGALLALVAQPFAARALAAELVDGKLVSSLTCQTARDRDSNRGFAI